MQFWIKSGGILILIGILFSQTGYAEEKKKFVIGVQNFKEYHPYSFMEGKGYQGFNREILDMFAKSKGYIFVYKPYPIKRLLKNYLHRKTDFKYPDNPYWAADLKKGHTLSYSDPVVKYIDGVMVLPEKLGKGETQLKKLGVMLGFTPFVFLNQIKAGKIRKFEVPHYPELIRKVIKELIDGAYLNITVGRYYMRNDAGLSTMLIFDSSLPHTKSSRHLSTLEYPQVVSEFNDFLKTNKTAIDTLKRNYKVEDGVPLD